MKQYLNVVRNILDTGTRKENRTGVDTLSTFGHLMKFDMRNGEFPLLTTKKISWKNIVVENLWFLSGDPHIGILQTHKCKFWDAWADEDGRVPSAYGNFWRRFPVHMPHEFGSEPDCSRCGTYGPSGGDQVPCPGFNDQIAWAIAELKRNPMSRRVVITAWAPGNAQTSKLSPCHITFAFNVQLDQDGEQILCLHLTQRSCDIALGVPYNIAGYAFLLELFSRFTGIPVGIFGHTLIDAHAYTAKPDGSMAEYDHVPGLREQLARKPRPLPRLWISPEISKLDDVHELLNASTEVVMNHFVLEGYDPHPVIKFKVAV